MDLKKLSLNELWELFPITFVDWEDQFEKYYSEERQKLKLLLGNYPKRISHIGSTAIKNIKTKPIIDILIEIDFDNKAAVKNLLLSDNYILMSEENNKISLNKGYTVNGYADKVFHIHIKNYGECDELYFRDYLNEHPQKAKEYEKLKLALFDRYKPNRDLYTQGKGKFVNEVVNSAKAEFKERYE